jgi:hypothetical protein
VGSKEKEDFHAKNEDQASCGEAFYSAFVRQNQARPGVQAPHPDQEES